MSDYLGCYKEMTEAETEEKNAQSDYEDRLPRHTQGGVVEAEWLDPFC